MPLEALRLPLQEAGDHLGAGGEVVHGRVAQYSVEEHGFFLFPTAPENNNERIFVVVQALKTLYVETLADGES